jgi:type I restriction enzyme M protein
LHNYGNLKDMDKPLIVSGILLALNGLDIHCLTGDNVVTDGQKLFNAIENNLQMSGISTVFEKDKLLRQFAIFKNSVALNVINSSLKKTPLRHFTEFLNAKIYNAIRHSRSSCDYLGRFYGEFMANASGDGQTLGIVLTPNHITDLFCDLVAIRPDDVVLDPCAGTAGFLVAAMYHMLAQTADETEKRKIRQERLHGIEYQEYMFTLATSNMLMRGDGKSNVLHSDFLKENTSHIQLKKATVGMLNPPYSQGSKSNPASYEIAFTKHLLDSLIMGGRAIVILPQSALTGKTKDEQAIKTAILEQHSLEGVITLNKHTFYGIGTVPCIAIFTAGKPHHANKACKFIDFKDDGYLVSPHTGLIETAQAKPKKQHLLDVWFNRVDSISQFCVSTPITDTDEWLHSFYSFNDAIPTDEEFEKTVGEYLAFEFAMLMQGCGYLFNHYGNPVAAHSHYDDIPPLNASKWGTFSIGELFSVESTLTTQPSALKTGGITPRITCSSLNNGLENTYSNLATETGGVLVVESAATGYVSFQETDFIATDHVEKIALKDGRRLNRYLGLFIKASITQAISGKYNYGYKFSKNRIVKQKIVLPVNNSGQPDYAYMEQYISTIMDKKIRKYLAYLSLSAVIQA